MWLSKQTKPVTLTTDADLGLTTITGNQVGVVTRGEVRNLPVYGPGGYMWMPENGAEVLVIKGGPGGEEHCVAGTRQKDVPSGMLPGEIYLQGPNGNSVYLRRNGNLELYGGTVSIYGNVMINGQPYRPCSCG